MKRYPKILSVHDEIENETAILIVQNFGLAFFVVCYISKGVSF